MESIGRDGDILAEGRERNFGMQSKGGGLVEVGGWARERFQEEKEG